MDLDSFIEFMEQADPQMAAMVRDGYCSWEDIGYDPYDDPLSGDEPVGMERGETDLSDGMGCASCEG